jgi:hypothetical protein
VSELPGRLVAEQVSRQMPQIGVSNGDLAGWPIDAGDELEVVSCHRCLEVDFIWMP